MTTPKTVQEWLDQKDLPVALTPGPWEHDIFTGTASLPDFMCKKCEWTCSLGAMADFIGDGIAKLEHGKYVLYPPVNPRKRLTRTSGHHPYHPDCPVPAAMAERSKA